MTLLEIIYFMGYSLKKYYALKNRKRLPYKVISIGNISVGGTGKTPTTIALAKEAIKRDFRPCILTRGYKGKAKGPCFVSKGEDSLLDEYEVGDEALLMAEKLKKVPIIKGESRYEAGKLATDSFPKESCPNLFILDDGFQHWYLFRDIDIVLIDGMNPFGNKRLLPIGPLREPISSISRADIIVITKTFSNFSKGTDYPHPKSDIDNLLKQIRKYNTDVPIFFARHKPIEFITFRGEKFPLEWAIGKKVFGFCGIGNHESFLKTLLSLEIELKGFKKYKDHHRYTNSDIGIIIKEAKHSGAQWIVTTEKDRMRLKGFEGINNLISLAIEFDINEKFYEIVFSLLSQR